MSKESSYGEFSTEEFMARMEMGRDLAGQLLNREEVYDSLGFSQRQKEGIQYILEAISNKGDAVGGYNADEKSPFKWSAYFNTHMGNGYLRFNREGDYNIAGAVWRGTQNARTFSDQRVPNILLRSNADGEPTSVDDLLKIWKPSIWIPIQTRVLLLLSTGSIYLPCHVFPMDRQGSRITYFVPLVEGISQFQRLGHMESGSQKFEVIAETVMPSLDQVTNAYQHNQALSRTYKI